MKTIEEKNTSKNQSGKKLVRNSKVAQKITSSKPAQKIAKKTEQRKETKKINTERRTNHRVPIRTYVDKEGSDKTRTPFRQFRMIIYVAIKRVFDTSIALIGLLVLSPLMVIIAILIKIDSKGPVFFKQARTGKYGKEFKIIKFRSMHVDNDAMNFKEEDKVTKIGKFLRKTSLDELPQLFNIVKQDMAIIGPRPWVPEYYKYMDKNQRRRYDVRPGITGLAQCSGRNNLTIQQKINYDRQYVHHYSLKQDISVIIKTIKCVLNSSGIGDGKETMKEEILSLKKQDKK